MGTNVYLWMSDTESDDYGSIIHVGKFSHGWRFCVDGRATKCATFNDFREFMRENTEYGAWILKDEYGGEVALEDFYEKIYERQGLKYVSEDTHSSGPVDISHYGDWC